VKLFHFVAIFLPAFGGLLLQAVKDLLHGCGTPDANSALHMWYDLRTVTFFFFLSENFAHWCCLGVLTTWFLAQCF